MPNSASVSGLARSGPSSATALLVPVNPRRRRAAVLNAAAGPATRGCTARGTFARSSSP